MKLHVVKNYDEMSKLAFNYLVKVVKDKPNAILGLATGSSPIGLYQLLIEDHKQNKTSYKDITTFNLDEYFGLDSDHEQSYYHFMNENLFNHIDIDPKNINIPSGHTENAQAECDMYNKKLKEHTIDVQILGIGSNGHIGFNEPGTPFENETHVIELDEETRVDNARFFNDLSEVPTHAITMGIKNILAANKIILLAQGEKKAEAIFKMFNEEATPNLPASALQNHDNVIVICDEEAASLMTKKLMEIN